MWKAFVRDRVVIRIKTPQQVTFLALVRSIEDFREELATKGSVSAYQPIKRGYSRAYLTQAGIAYFWEQSQEVFSDSGSCLIQRTCGIPLGGSSFTTNYLSIRFIRSKAESTTLVASGVELWFPDSGR
jgi:hypothetical protein